MKNIFYFILGVVIIICIFGCTNYQDSRSIVDLTVYEALRKENDSLRIRLAEVEKLNKTLLTEINY